KLKAHIRQVHVVDSIVRTADGSHVKVRRKDGSPTGHLDCPNRSCRCIYRYTTSLARHLREGPCCDWSPHVHPKKVPGVDYGTDRPIPWRGQPKHRRSIFD
ncbi:hypothetical protein BGW41_004612, partial [Actinomortierella wolfii]